MPLITMSTEVFMFTANLFIYVAATGCPASYRADAPSTSYPLGVRSDCPDCDSVLRPVRVMDATHDLPIKTGGAHVELAYAAVDAKPSFFMRAVPAEGVLRAMLCPECGRAFLYAVPHD